MRWGEDSLWEKVVNEEKTLNNDLCHQECTKHHRCNPRCSSNPLKQPTLPVCCFIMQAFCWRLNIMFSSNCFFPWTEFLGPHYLAGCIQIPPPIGDLKLNYGPNLNLNIPNTHCHLIGGSCCGCCTASDRTNVKGIYLFKHPKCCRRGFCAYWSRALMKAIDPKHENQSEWTGTYQDFGLAAANRILTPFRVSETPVHVYSR